MIAPSPRAAPKQRHTQMRGPPLQVILIQLLPFYFGYAQQVVPPLFRNLSAHLVSHKLG